MQLNTHNIGDIAVLSLSGRFDVNTAPNVADWLNQATLNSPARIIVNMANTTFVDSTGLATLVQALKRCRQGKGDLHICGLQRSVYIIFELTRLDKAFNIFVDESHAVQAFMN
jgi:anti-sigma B factor antagonist